MRYIVIWLFALLGMQYVCLAKQLVTNPLRDDGFGAQFQTIIYSVIYAELCDAQFVYTPFKDMEHNYDNDAHFIAKKEWLINFIDNFDNCIGDILRVDAGDMIHFFESNLKKCSQSNALKRIKQIFRANKNIHDYFDDRYLNISIHIRRPNLHDNRIYGTNISDDVYLNIINKLRIKYVFQNPLFHVHSQGKIENFKNFNASDIVLHLNESIEDSFTAMVLSDVLVTSRSSFSYTAGILCQGTVYYIQFWHPALPGWIPVSELFED
jgi:hypothetical protein